MIQRHLILAAIFITSITSHGQQVVDDNYLFTNPNPSFSTNEGPKLCFDHGHYNFHNMDGNYRPFANLVRSDGFDISPIEGNFTIDLLEGCDLLVIVNAFNERNVNDWDYPHPSAFTDEEIGELLDWITNGGNLLLVADHSPVAGAVGALGAVLGILIVDADASGNTSPDGPDVFNIDAGTLISHRITEGGPNDEEIDTLYTFSGSAAHLSDLWDPLLIFGTNATATIDPRHHNRKASANGDPLFSIEGWSQGASRYLGLGKIVFLGEAAMCSAQITGPDRHEMGMNLPLAEQNAQFCLNTVRWLTGVLD